MTAMVVARNTPQSSILIVAQFRRVGKAKRAHGFFFGTKEIVGTAPSRLCPPYGIDGVVARLSRAIQESRGLRWRARSHHVRHDVLEPGHDSDGCGAQHTTILNSDRRPVS
ncbi:hypothetical protein [Bradyrhizobium sp. CCBAU 45384]|uniref:hypothetical protein n=1 Tax=Bradyrhizobium sp. CCBAU 45384 TaxID=858428 RepID=UPI002305A64D|nr:hypothetical protein [Bradyrhizobium sp. CCBAU 45384]